MSGLQLKITSWGEVALDKREMRALMRSAGNDVKSKTARLIGQTAGTGRTYRGGGGSRYRGTYRAGHYRASAPGDPPVRVTGSLRQSLRVYAFKDGNGFAVRERQFYSLFLEAGARGGGKPGRGRAARRRASATRVLAPRPHLDRVMQQEAPALDRRVRTALDRGLKWRQTK